MPLDTKKTRTRAYFYPFLVLAGTICMYPQRSPASTAYPLPDPTHNKASASLMNSWVCCPGERSLSRCARLIPQIPPIATFLFFSTAEHKCTGGFRFSEQSNRGNRFSSSLTKNKTVVRCPQFAGLQIYPSAVFLKLYTKERSLLSPWRENTFSNSDV